MSIFTTFVSRMKKIGIDIELMYNIPWVYIIKINGVPVTEKFQSEHGFVIGYTATRLDNKDSFTHIGETIRLVRKYKYIHYNYGI